MSDPEPSLKPNVKAIASDLYKEAAKWLFELAKPLLATAGLGIGVFVASKFAMFDAFLTTDLKINHYQIILLMLVVASASFCVSAPYFGLRAKRRQAEACKLMRAEVEIANEKAEKAETLAKEKIAELEKRALSAEEVAARDPLTGLFNLRELETRLKRSVMEAYDKKQPLSMILMDIDDFGLKNEEYGYPAGDAILKQFAYGLVEGSRRKDPFFRYRSGDEFAVLTLNQDKHGAQAFAKRVLNETRISKFEVRDTKKQRQVVNITISAGVAEILFPRDKSPNFEEVAISLESQAQAALAEAKSFKDRVIVFDSAVTG